MKEIVEQQFKKYMNSLSKDIAYFNTKIENGAFFSENELRIFDIHLKSLGSMEIQFVNHRNDAEEILFAIKNTLSIRLLYLEK